MNDLQRKLLGILIWIDDFCKKNNIKYYLIGGTELGAIRHGGFIPWDDDADIGMPRDDYKKFIELTKNQLFADHYFVESPYCSEKDYYYPFCKVFDLETTLIEKTRNNFVRGLYVDIFPLDGLGNNMVEAKKFFNKCYRRNLPASLSMTGYRKGRKAYKNILVFLSHILFRPSKRILVRNDSKCSTKDFYKSAIIGNIHGAWAFKETVPFEVFDHGSEILFEGHLFNGVSEPDKYLTSLYGDYMMLPPPEKRKSHHDYVLLDINSSFRNHPTYNGYWKKNIGFMSKKITKEELHKLLYESMKILHNFLVNNDISYYAISGTLLGAIRHNGIIPWDDDIDIAMFRDQYNRFLKISEELNSSDIKVINYTNTKYIEHPLTKICLLKTKNNCSQSTDKFDHHFHIDVFPLDYVYKDDKKQKKLIKRAWKIRKLIYYKSVSLKNKKPLNKAGIAIYKFFLLPFSIQKMCKKYDLIVSAPNYKDDRNEDMLWTSGGIYSFEKELHDRKDFGKPTLHTFGLSKIFIPEHYDSFLKKTYGENYMTPLVRQSNERFDCELIDEKK